MCASQLCILSLPLFSPLPSSFLLLQMQFRSLFSLLAQFDKPRQFAADVALFADCLHYVRTIHTHAHTQTYLRLCFVFLLCILSSGVCIFILINIYCIWFCAIKTCSPTFGVCVCVFVVVAVCVCVRCLVFCVACCNLCSCFALLQPLLGRMKKITHVWVWSDCGLSQHTARWVNTLGKTNVS